MEPCAQPLPRFCFAAAAPVEVAPCPVLASALVAWLRAASPAICAAVLLALAVPGFVAFAVTVNAAITVLFQLVPFPAEVFRRGYDFSFIPTVPLRLLACVVSAISAGEWALIQASIWSRYS